MTFVSTVVSISVSPCGLCLGVPAASESAARATVRGRREIRQSQIVGSFLQVAESHFTLRRFSIRRKYRALSSSNCHHIHEVSSHPPPSMPSHLHLHSRINAAYFPACNSL